MKTIANATAAAPRFIDDSNEAYGAINSPAILGGAYLFAWNYSIVVNNVWTTGIQWKVPLPTSQIYTTTAFTLAVPAIFAISADASTIVIKTSNQYWGYNAATGASIWNLTLNYPTTANEQFCLQNVDDFVIFDPVAATFNTYSMLTGSLLWTSTSFASSPWATSWTVYWSETNDMNNLYAMFPDGSTRAYSLATGQLLWTSTPVTSTEYTENAIPEVNSLVLVGGNLYVFAGYTSQYKINPIPRFAELLCINATTGSIIWTLNGGIRPSSAADGYVIGTGDYDGLLYSLGKGQTTTTVTAQQQVGGSVLIQGTVMDNSQAQPNTPAISDANMSVWMDYVHMQNSTLLNAPPNCIGVPVSLTAIAPDGTSTNIGTVTSDGTGQFAYQWTPTTAGLYAIYATFSGTNSYYESYGETHATVASTTTATTTPTAATPTPAPTATSTTASNVNTNTVAMYIVIAAIAIIIAVAIVGLLILRKKP